MKLVFAMLADAAVALPDGKVDIQGGGINVLRAVSLPAIHPRLTLVVKVAAEPGDRSREAALLLEGFTPDREQWLTPTPIALHWKKPAKAGRSAEHLIVVNLPMLLLLKYGEYTIRLSSGDEELVTLPLFVDLIEPSQRKTEATKGSRVQQ
jgi:hypothetical protein